MQSIVGYFPVSEFFNSHACSRQLNNSTGQGRRRIEPEV
jgi:hypothetical protein